MRFAEEGGEEQIRRHRGIRGEVGREEPLGATGPLVVELQSEGWMQDCGGDDRAVTGVAAVESVTLRAFLSS